MIKVMCFTVQCPEVEISQLIESGFLAKLESLFLNISDLVQGEEILELVNIVLRKIFNHIGLKEYSFEAVAKVHDTLKKLMNSEAKVLPSFHDKAVELLSNS